MMTYFLLFLIFGLLKQNMKYNTRIEDSFELLSQLYASSTGQVIDELWASDKCFISPKGIFPPIDVDSFSSKAAEEGFYEYNCAVLTAFRGQDKNGILLSLNQKQARNELLLKCLLRRKKQHLLDFVYYVKGCFKEEGRPAEEPEDCFFIYANNNKPEIEFFSSIYRLSERFEQDSFLYKCAGRTRTAFCVSTNKASRKKYGLVKCAGQLWLDLPENGPYTNLSKGRFTFRETPPTEEELAYSKRPR